MAKEVTRNLKKPVVVELWARATSRCQFNNCNRPLYKSPVTQEQGNISEIAHIWSFSEKLNLCRTIEKSSQGGNKN